MREVTATVTSKGQITLPAEVRRLLGLKPQDKLVFAIDGNEVRLQPARFTLENVLGSVEPLPGTTTEDFERQINEAMEDRAADIVRTLNQT